MNEKVSIVLPVFNMEKYILDAIKSIQQQTYTNWELIIIDDASTDGSEERIRSVKDKRIKYIKNGKQIGTYPSRNRGLTVTTGKYIAVMDADDIAHPERLEIQVDFLESNSDILAVGTQFVFLNQKETYLKPQNYSDILISLLYNNCFLHPSMMIHRELFLAIGGYNEEYVYASDYDLMCRLALLGKVENLPNSLMYYRCHPKQISSLYIKEQAAYANKIRKNYQRVFISKFKSDDLKIPTASMFEIPDVGEIFCCYLYARHANAATYAKRADYLLDNLLDFAANKFVSINYIATIGQWLIYLMNNKFVQGNQDDVLSDFDSLLKCATEFEGTLTDETKYNLSLYWRLRGSQIG